MMDKNTSLSASNKEKQEALLAFFRTYQQQRHQPPTLSEVADFLGGANSSVVRHHLNGLVYQKKLARRPTGARRYFLPHAEPNVPEIMLEVRDHVAAGEDADEVLRRLTIDRLRGDEREVFECIVGNLEITGFELGEYLAMPKNRIWAAVDRLLELKLVVRHYDEEEREFIYRMVESE